MIYEMTAIHYIWVLLGFLFILCIENETQTPENAAVYLHVPTITGTEVEQQLTYDREHLLQIRDAVRHRKAYNVIPLSVCVRIRSYKLQR